MKSTKEEKTLTPIELTDIQFRYTDTSIGRLSTFILGDTLVLVPSTKEIYDLMQEVENIAAIKDNNPVEKFILVPVADEVK